MPGDIFPVVCDSSLSICAKALTKAMSPPPFVPLDGCCSPRLPARQRPPSTTCSYSRNSAVWRLLPATPQKLPPWVLWRPLSSAAVGPLSCSPSLAGRRRQGLPGDVLLNWRSSLGIPRVALGQVWLPPKDSRQHSGTPNPLAPV